MKIKLTENKLRQIIAESVKRVLNEKVTTTYGTDSELNPDYDENAGYFQDYENDYWGNWVSTSDKYNYKNFNHIPKNGRHIAQICEKYVEKILNKFDATIEDIRTSVNLTDGDLSISIYVDARWENEHCRFRFNAGEYSHPLCQDVSNVIMNTLKRRLKHIGNVRFGGGSLNQINIFIENFVDKNGVENVEQGIGTGTKRRPFDY